MENAEKIKNVAKDSREKLENFLRNKPNLEREFRASFHLRPTSSLNVTIVSTLPFAPMRGIANIKIDELENKLSKIIKILSESSDIKKLEMMKELGFKKRKIISQREEDAQAALIRDLILSPEKYDNLQFIASEFELFEYRKEKVNRPDVFAYKDGILYDIELKNKRETFTVTQAEGYVTHIKDNLKIYNDCLNEFPNCKIGEIKDVKGIALVPYAENPPPKLENAGKNAGIELWYFNIIKNYDTYNFIRK